MGSVLRNIALEIEKIFGVPYDLIGFIIGVIALSFLTYYYFFRK